MSKTTSSEREKEEEKTEKGKVSEVGPTTVSRQFLCYVSMDRGSRPADASNENVRRVGRLL